MKRLLFYVFVMISVVTIPELSAQKKELTKFPKGSTPEDVGVRIVKRYLATPHTISGIPRQERAPRQIFYADVCTWLGGLWFTQTIGDKDLYNQLEDRFQSLFSEDKHLQPRPDHVDNNVFGAVPLELYKHNRRNDYLQLGLMYADSQWTLPENAKDPEKAWHEKGHSWQTRIWIDDMFMITAVQLQAYHVTGDVKYRDRAAKEMVMYLDEIQRANGLFYHTPQVPFYWARGNGWMAVGMAEILRVLPKNHPERPAILKAYHLMMSTLLAHQAEDGMWRQLIDDPESWKETSGTAMFTYAMIVGVKKGWLDAKIYAPAARKAWLQLLTYLDEKDEIRDVCLGTGAKNSYQYYLDRKRITGDLHGQAPLLWCAYALLSK